MKNLAVQAFAKAGAGLLLGALLLFGPAGTLFTEPETQPDGSVTFRQLSLQLDEETFAGWGGEGPLVPAFAEPSLVRLVPTENGWRVAQLSLPY